MKNNKWILLLPFGVLIWVLLRALKREADQVESLRWKVDRLNDLIQDRTLPKLKLAIEVIEHTSQYLKHLQPKGPTIWIKPKEGK